MKVSHKQTTTTLLFLTLACCLNQLRFNTSAAVVGEDRRHYRQQVRKLHQRCCLLIGWSFCEGCSSKGSVASYMRHKSWLALQCNSTVPRNSYIINIRCVNVVTIMLTGLLWKNYSDQFWMVCDYDVYRSVTLLVNWPGSVVTKLN